MIGSQGIVVKCTAAIFFPMVDSDEKARLPNRVWFLSSQESDPPPKFLNGFQHGGRKPTETSVTEFCYKSVNLSLEELKNIKVILFLIQ